jgi:4-hydroxy-2-oxoheptanedioate aldolase
MPLPSDILVNRFKQALAERKPQIGLWLALAHSYTAEICAGAGFDWFLIDGEHAPNTLQTILQQQQALAAYPGAAVVRPPWNDSVHLKQILDTGAQNFLVPMVQSAEDAAAAVQAIRYPPHGIRGVGSGLARASRWGRVPDYLRRADEELCLLVQVETMQAIDALDAILEVEGVDGVFIGPADLAASMGHLGNPGHAEVQRVVETAITKIAGSGKAAGVLTVDQNQAKRFLELGALFVAVGVDAIILARGVDALARAFHSDNAGRVRVGSAPY